jgi:hypothetical protein
MPKPSDDTLLTLGKAREAIMSVHARAQLDNPENDHWRAACLECLIAISKSLGDTTEFDR